MICDKCGYEYSIGEKGEYKNIYGTRCHKCNHIIKPLDKPLFIKKKEDKMAELYEKYLPIIRQELRNKKREI